MDVGGACVGPSNQGEKACSVRRGSEVEVGRGEMAVCGKWVVVGRSGSSFCRLRNGVAVAVDGEGAGGQAGAQGGCRMSRPAKHEMSDETEQRWW